MKLISNKIASAIQPVCLALLVVSFQSVAQDNTRETTDMSRQTVRQFVEAINARDADKICSLMTDDHKFIDSQGNELTGKDTMKKAWKMYFEWFPDYKIEVNDMFVRGDTVAAFGFAGGTLHGLKERRDLYWHLPASWKAKVSNGKISVWQVYADAKIPFDIIAKAK